MPVVADILKTKGNQVTTVQPTLSIRDAAVLMNEHRIGSVIVLLDDGRIAGICSERDVLERVVAQERDPAVTTVGEVMTAKVICCLAHAPLDEVRKTFRTRRVRHLPVVDAEGRLEGLISIGDLNAWDLDGQAVEIQYLHEYIHGTF